MPFLLPAFSTLQALFAAYNLYLSSISISNLLGYEEKSKKAAEWSNTAAQQLHKTRTTQASGTLAVLASFLSSLYTTFSSNSKITAILLSLANIGILIAARAHTGAFWKGSARIPLPKMGDYNEAMKKTLEVRLNSAYLAVSWGVLGVWAMVA